MKTLKADFEILSGMTHTQTQTQSKLASYTTTYPTGFFKILEPQDQEVGDVYVKIAQGSPVG